MSTTEDNLVGILLDAASRYPDRPAVRSGERVLSYRELDEASARFATYLTACGVEVGDRVGLMLPNEPEFVVVYYGILRVGAVVVPMNPLLKAREVAYHLTDSAATALFAWHGIQQHASEGARQAGVANHTVEPEGFAALLAAHEPHREVASRASDDTAVILYTSGTTGRPKGAELTHANLTRNVEVTRTTLLRLSETDVVFGALPLFHSFGQVVGMNCATAAGACLALLPRFTAEQALALIERERVTTFAGVPTMYTVILGCPTYADYDTSSLRVCVSGGASLPLEVLHTFEKEFSCTILEGYGLSETSPVACFNLPDRPRRPGTVGVPVEGVEMRVQDDDWREVPDGTVGEIAVRGHNVMKGYWRRPEATAEAIRDGWLRTGDLGIRDDTGYFRIVDRKKDMIIRGGYNVYPREVEEILYEHPAVAEAAVIGVPHPTLGEEVAAAVALRPGRSATTDELREFVSEQVAAYKYPRLVWIVDALPKGATGKILKRAIKPPADLTDRPAS